MSYPQCEEDDYTQRILPGVIQFHTDNPLFWMAKDKNARDFEAIIDGPEHNNPVVPSEGFLDATNIWLQQPDLAPEDKLSIEGKMYIDEIQWIMNRVQKKVSESYYETFEPIIISNMTLDEYLEAIKAKLPDGQEYEYVKSIALKMYEETVRMYLHRKPSLLELLEIRQKQRGRAFLSSAEILLPD